MLCSRPWRLMDLVTALTLLATIIPECKARLTVEVALRELYLKAPLTHCCKPGSTSPSLNCMECALRFKLCVGLSGIECSLVAMDFAVDSRSGKFPYGDVRATERAHFTARWVNSTVLVSMQVSDAVNGKLLLVSKAQTKLSPLDAMPQTLSSYADGTSLSYDVSVKCISGYTGPECSTICPPPTSRDHYHYTCSPGGMQCHSGWDGPRCERPLCPNGCENGKCIAPNTCSCFGGWDGPMCTQCVPYSGCQNGFCHTPNTCVCKENWTGHLCDVMIDQCRESPCRNGGTCTSEGRNNHYKCICPAGFKGENCTEFDPKAGSSATLECFAPEEGRSYRSGQNWKTLDCRQCSCFHGTTICSNTSASCEPRNCALPHIKCPAKHHCFVTQAMPNKCLSGECKTATVGYCRPLKHMTVRNQVVSCVKRRSLHADSHHRHAPTCARMLFEMDPLQTPSGTTTDDLCHHLLLVLLAENLDNFGFDCRRLFPADRMLVEVDLVGILPHLSVDRVQSHLKAKLLRNTTPSPILQAIRTISLSNMNFNVEQVLQRIITTPASGTSGSDLDATRVQLATIAVVLSAICVILLVLIVVIVLRNEASRDALRKLCGDCMRRECQQVDSSDEHSELKARSSYSGNPTQAGSALRTASSHYLTALCPPPSYEDIVNTSRSKLVIQRLADTKADDDESV